MNPHYAQVALRAGHRCEYCHAPEAVFNFPLEVEHNLDAILKAVQVDNGPLELWYPDFFGLDIKHAYIRALNDLYNLNQQPPNTTLLRHSSDL